MKDILFNILYIYYIIEDYIEEKYYEYKHKV